MSVPTGDIPPLGENYSIQTRILEMGSKHLESGSLGICRNTKPSTRGLRILPVGRNLIESRGKFCFLSKMDPISSKHTQFTIQSDQGYEMSKILHFFPQESVGRRRTAGSQGDSS